MLNTFRYEDGIYLSVIMNISKIMNINVIIIYIRTCYVFRMVIPAYNKNVK
jgi:hypothetical protein